MTKYESHVMITAHRSEGKTPLPLLMRLIEPPNRLRLGLTAIGLASLLGYLSVIARITGRPVFLRWGFPRGDFLGIFRAGAKDSATLGIILGFPLLFRLLILPAPPVLSSDIFRYIWDARVLA